MEENIAESPFDASTVFLHESTTGRASPLSSSQRPRRIAKRDNTSIALLDLPTEVLLHILTFLGISDLLSISRTCHTLRPLTLDPLLHRHRRRLARHSLSISLPHRPALSSIRPPSANIYLTKTLFASRRFGRRLISIRLSRQLSRRPTPAELVDRGVLPDGCFVKVVAPASLNSRGSLLSQGSLETNNSELEKQEDTRSRKSETWARAAVSPQLLSARRALERETVKDKLRRFLLGKGLEEVRRRRREREEERVGVRDLARKFASKEKRGSEEKRMGAAAAWRAARMPARANVLRLRRFWETVGA